MAALQRLSRENAMPFMRGLHTVAEDRAYFRERVFPVCEVWVAESDLRLVGMCAFRPGWVDHLYVHPIHHGAGIGTALLTKAKETNHELRLWVFQSNAPAIRFYERRGFTLVHRSDGRDNEERQPDALYATQRSSATAREPRWSFALRGVPDAPTPPSAKSPRGRRA